MHVTAESSSDPVAVNCHPCGNYLHTRSLCPHKLILAVITSWSRKARRLVGMFIFAVKTLASNQLMNGQGLEIVLSTLLLIYYYMYGRQPKVILTNVLRTKLGRKYTQAQLKTGANFSDAGKLRSDQPPSSSVASVTIWQILNPTLQSLFLSKRQPKVILTNVLRTKIGRKYIDSHVIIDADLSDADKLLSGQLPSSSVASLQTCQILSSSHESTFLSERYVTHSLLSRNFCFKSFLIAGTYLVDSISSFKSKIKIKNIASFLPHS
uniref:SUMO specific peptidase 7 n=1 Tax=Calidris pygmaea TaxID=425635 RepID=A0A8C3JLY0_9CHAR